MPRVIEAACSDWKAAYMNVEKASVLLSNFVFRVSSLRLASHPTNLLLLLLFLTLLFSPSPFLFSIFNFLFFSHPSSNLLQ